MKIEDVQKISEIQVQPIKPNNGLVAFASFIYDNAFYLGSIGIYTRLDGTGYRLTYPTRKIGTVSLNIYNPISGSIGILIEELIVAKYEEILAKAYESQ
jgi:stage V sporulation protein G